MNRRRIAATAALVALGVAGCAPKPSLPTPTPTPTTSPSATSSATATASATPSASATTTATATAGPSSATAPASSASSSAPQSTAKLATAASGTIKLSQGWIAASTSDSSAAYVTIESTGGADALLSVRTSAAGMVQLHETVSSGTSGTMQQVPQIGVPAGGSVALKPGGYHVMLMQLTRKLEAGTSVTVTLIFTSGASITTDFPVIPREQRP